MSASKKGPVFWSFWSRHIFSPAFWRGRGALDRLHHVLAVFTYVYIGTVGVIFFSGVHMASPRLVSFLEALKDPYLGALGIYVVLKEIRKRRYGISHYWGEVFVVWWIALLVMATAVTALSPYHAFDSLYWVIFTTSSVALLLFIGSRIHIP